MPRMPLARIIPLFFLCLILFTPASPAGSILTAIGQLPAAGQSPVNQSPFPGTGGSVGGMCLANPGGNPSATGVCSENPAAAPSNQPAMAAGNPVNVLSGNKFQSETDLPALPGILGLQLSRSYNSQSRHAGLLGFGWRHAYEVSLQDDPEKLQIVQADGRRLVFPKDAQGGCTSVQPEDGHVERTDKGWRWTWRGGRVLEFTAFGQSGSGRLTSLRDDTLPGKPFLTFRYGLNGELLAIRDAQGREAQVSRGVYGPQRLPEIRVTTPVGVFVYRQDRGGNLVVAGRPDGNWTGYYYEASRNGGDPHNLTGRAVWNAVTKRWQRQATWAYDASDRAILSEHAGGVERVAMAYDPAVSGRPHGVRGESPDFRTILTNSVGQTTEYQWRLVGLDYRLLSVRGAGCATCGPVNRRYEYNAAGQVTREERLATGGRVLSFVSTAYDSLGRAVSMQTGGAALKPETVHFEYADPAHPWLWTGEHHASVQTGNEAGVRRDFDRDGRVTRLTEFGYSPLGGKLERSRCFFYDAAGRLIREEEPVSPGEASTPGVTRFAYDDHGFLNRLDGVDGSVIEVVRRDAVGRLLSWRLTQGARSESQAMTYDALGRPLSLTRQAAGMKPRHWFWIYGVDGQLAARTDEQGLTVGYRYDEAGRLNNRQLPDGRERVERHDSEDRLLQWQVRADGKTLRQQDWRYEDRAEDVLTRVSDDVGLLGERVASRDGLQTAYRDGLGRESLILRDGRGRLLTTLLAANGAFSPVSQQQFGPGKRLVAEGPLLAGELRDDWGRLAVRRLPGRGLQLFQYDARDNPVATVDEAGRRLRHDYDAAGRLIAVRVDDGEPAVRMVYKDGLLIERRSTKESRRYQYNGFGEPEAEVRTFDEPSAEPSPVRPVTRKAGPRRQWFVRYRRDDGGRLIEEDRNGLRVQYAYDAAGRISRVSGDGQLLADNIRYDATGGLAGYDLAYGTQIRIVRDARGRLVAIDITRATASEHPALSKLLHVVLPVRPARELEQWLGWTGTLSESRFSSYDGADRLQLSIDDDRVRHYRYDARDRLTSVSEGLGNEDMPLVRYAYDEAGNRQMKVGQPGRTVYQYAPNHLSLLAQAEVSEDTAKPGLLTALTGYDSTGKPWLWWQQAPMSLQGKENRGLWRLQLSGSQPQAWQNEAGERVMHYGYDLDGLPLWQQTGDGWRQLTAYQGSQRLWEIEERAGESFRRDYVSLMGVPIAVRIQASGQANVWGEVLPNRQFAPVTVLDDTHQVRWSTAYGAFGEREAGALPVASSAKQELNRWAISLRLPGQYEDVVTGWYVNGYRTYLPSLGRYLTPDPSGSADGLNPYVYAGSNPLNRVDPWGLYQIDMHYYMTYFLGIVTGFSADQARTIALATQFVDENDYTTPFRDGVGYGANAVDWFHDMTDKRLEYYHFVNTVNDEGVLDFAPHDPGSFDPAFVKGSSPEDYKIERLTGGLDRCHIPDDCRRF